VPRVSTYVTRMGRSCPAGEMYSFLALKCICIEGYTRHASSGQCRLCPIGTHKHETGDQACSACPAGKYGAPARTFIAITGLQTGSNNCTSCPAHSNSVNGSSATTGCKCNAGYTGPDGGTCVACVAGTFKASNGSDACTQCAAGKYSAATGATSDSCADCARDTYSSADSTQCEACPSDTVSAALSSKETDCKCNAGYTGPDGGTCVACVAGTFKASNGSDACTQCAAGKYSAENGEISKTTCTDCPSNTYSPSGSGLLTNCTCIKGYTPVSLGNDGVACSACVAGTFKDVNGTAECTQCAAGEYSTATAATSVSTCIDCPSNTYSPSGSGRLTNCTCIKGYTPLSPGNDGVACDACVAGTFKDVNGSAECTQCAAGEYSTATAATSVSTCMDCPSDSYSGTGSGVLTDCICNKGYNGKDGGACSACFVGTYKDVNGSSSCIRCSPGQYSNLKAATTMATCKSCPRDTYNASDNSLCLACPDNSHSNAKSFVESACKCNVGYTGADGTACTACLAGSYKAINGSAACRDCAAGKYNNLTAASSVRYSDQSPCRGIFFAVC